MKPALPSKLATVLGSLDRIEALALKMQASLDLIEARLLKLKLLEKASALQTRVRRGLH
jgi:hypothetical protein